VKFTPRSDKELEELNLITDGEYKADIFEASDGKDKNGNGMISLKLKVYDSNGKTRIMSDWLLESFPVKLKHFFYSSGMEEKYDSGEIYAKDCLYKEVIVSIITQPDKNGKKWNRVEDYIKVVSSPSIKNNFIDSDLPDLFS